MKKLKRFWDWFDDLASHSPVLRFMIFMLISTVGYVIIPISLKITLDMDLAFGQMIGTLFMLVLLLTKLFRNRD